MKKTTLIINGKPFIFENEVGDISYDSESAISEEDAAKLLSKTKELFDKINLSFYLAYGTLLGAVRDKGLIQGDEDVDIFIKDEDTLYNNLPFLYENGYKLCRIYKGVYYSFRLDRNAYIDVYILKSFRFSFWMLYCFSLANTAVPKKYFREYEDIDFLGAVYKCPKHPEKLLEFWYGKTWRIPVDGHKFYYQVKSAYYWNTYIKPYIKYIIQIVTGYKYLKDRINK